MKKTICFLAGLVFSCTVQLMAQQYTAIDYWKLEHDSFYSVLKQRQNSGDSLSVKELSFLSEHKAKLEDYFEKMSDNEKSIYYKNRATWSDQSAGAQKNIVQQNGDVFSGEKSTYSKYIASSGFFGLIYGSAAESIMKLEGGGVVGLPLLAAGVSTLIPIISVKNKQVTYNSLKLSLHGKTMGLLHGAALGLLLFGENVNNNEDLLVSLATVSSIGMGRLGYVLGRDRPWSRGQAALYSHYGLLMPFEGLALDAALNIEDPRIYAATFLAFGAGGYLLADRIGRWNDFTVGDITSTQTFAVLNGGLGFAIMTDILDNSDGSPGLLLIPAAGALGGTVVSNFWLKDAHLTNQQGRNVALGTTGGAAIGLGLCAILGFESFTPYYVMPYLTGFTTYAILVSKYKQNNQLAFLKPGRNNRWDVNFMPQNLLINKHIANNTSYRSGTRTIFLPAFTASCRF